MNVPNLSHLNYPSNLSLEEIIELTIEELIPVWKKMEKDDDKPLSLPDLNTGIRLCGMFHGRNIDLNIYRLGLRFWMEDRKRNAKDIKELIIEKVCSDLSIPRYLAS